MNKVFLIGKVSREVDVLPTKTGKSFAKMSVETEEKGFTGKDGSVYGGGKDWHSVLCYGDCGKTVENEVKEGDVVSVEGRINYRMWKDNNGVQNKETNIIADRVEIILPANAKPSKSENNSGEEDMPW